MYMYMYFPSMPSTLARMSRYVTRGARAQTMPRVFLLRLRRRSRGRHL